MLGDHIPMGFIASTDIERSQAFYEGVLGLRSLAYRGPAGGGKG